MFNPIRQTFDAYYRQIPPKTFSTAAISAICSFSFTLIYLRKTPDPLNMTAPLFNAGVSAMASLVYSITNPFFDLSFGDNRLLIHREVMKHMINVTLISVAVGFALSSKVNLTALHLLGIVPLNLIKSCLDLIPCLFELNGHEDAAQAIRKSYSFVGMHAEPGSASIFLRI
jgi:hypothetical protein